MPQHRNQSHGDRTETDGVIYSALPPFAAIEAQLAETSMEVFENIHLLIGVDVIGAVLDRGVDPIGEFGMTNERRDRITVHVDDAVNFANGVAVQADPGTYTVDQLLAMERYTWTLDSEASNDGLLAVWWLK